MNGSSEFQGSRFKPFDDETRAVEEYLVLLRILLKPESVNRKLQVRHCRRRGFVDLFPKVLSLSPLTR